MRPSEELFKLIHSLTRSEKRFFKISSTQLSGEKNYVKLFDFIDSQQKYDEQAIKVAFKNEAIVRNLPSEKNYLYRQILKSLRAYHTNNSVNSIIQKIIKNIEILYAKALYKECGKYIEKVKKIAVNNEKFHYLDEIVLWEYRLLEESLDRLELKKDVNQLIDELQNINSKRDNLHEFSCIYSQINHLFRIDGFVRSPQENNILKQIKQHPLVVNKNSALSVRASFMQHYIKGVCATIDRDFFKAQHLFAETKKILDEHIEIRKDVNTQYLLAVFGEIYALIALKKFSQVELRLQQIHSLNGTIAFDAQHTKNWIVFNVHLMELMCMQGQAKFDESVELITKRKKNFFVNKPAIGIEPLLLLNFYEAVSYFAINDYKTAISLIYELTNNNTIQLRNDIQIFARVFNILLYYEIGDYDYVNYAINSVDRMLKQLGKEKYAVELYFVRTIRKLCKQLPIDHEVTLQKFRSNILALYSNHTHKVTEEYFSFLAWTASKLNKTSYQCEVAKSVQC